MKETNNVADNKCPHCGANIKFSPTTQKWDCEYCGSSFTLEEYNKESKKDTKKENATEKKTTSKDKNDGEYVEYTCQNCGAQIITEPTTSATHCVYCGNTTLINSRLEGEFKPDKIIPFKTTKQDAIDSYKGIVKKAWFAPDEFSNEQNIEKITGVYVPFWLFDSKSYGKMDALASVIHSHRRGDYIIKNIDEYMCKREGSQDFIDVPADGSSKFADDIMEGIEPYNAVDYTQFDKAYLSGFVAEKYDQESSKVHDRAMERIQSTFTQNLKNTIRKGITNIVSSDIKQAEGEVEYALLPVWMLNVKFNNQYYTFAMNGQTKKCIGNIPIDKKKAIRKTVTSILIGGLIVGIITFIGGGLYI